MQTAHRTLRNLDSTCSTGMTVPIDILTVRFLFGNSSIPGESFICNCGLLNAVNWEEIMMWLVDYPKVTIVHCASPTSLKTRENA